MEHKQIVTIASLREYSPEATWGTVRVVNELAISLAIPGNKVVWVVFWVVDGSEEVTDLVAGRLPVARVHDQAVGSGR